MSAEGDAELEKQTRGNVLILPLDPQVRSLCTFRILEDVTRQDVVDARKRCRPSCKMANDRCFAALRLSESG